MKLREQLTHSRAGKENSKAIFVATGREIHTFTIHENKSYLTEHSTKSWDAIAATSNGSGFQVLLDGASKREGKYYIWDINSSGVITKGSG